MLVAIDPGNTHSALVVFSEGELVSFEYVPNEKALESIYVLADSPGVMAIEIMATYKGFTAGKSIFETCFWSGRFVEAWGQEFQGVYRASVICHFCGARSYNCPKTGNRKGYGDRHVRDAVLERFGGKKVAMGTKQKPGPLFKMPLWTEGGNDIYQAMAVGFYAQEKLKVAA